MITLGLTRARPDHTFHPSSEMNSAELKAGISDGVLSIDIPRKARKEAKVIDVKVD